MSANAAGVVVALDPPQVRSPAFRARRCIAKERQLRARDTLALQVLSTTGALLWSASVSRADYIDSPFRRSGAGAAWRRVALLAALTAFGFGLDARGGGAQVPVGTYLYANPRNLERFTGGLTITFAKPGEKMVIAYGRKHRKDRYSREGTTEEERETFKPYLAEMADTGRKAVFAHLPPDLYDLIVIQVKGMTVHEGLAMQLGAEPAQAAEALFKEVRDTLGPRQDRIGGWDAFFDTKQFDRFEYDGTRGAVFLQQLRKGKSLAESGAAIKGCIHSIDVCWVERAKVEGVPWQVVTRQQLYRDEIESREFFRHTHLPALSGLRVGVRAREIGPVELP